MSFKIVLEKIYMPRTTVIISCKNREISNQIISDVLRHNNYNAVTENNENVWKCDKGFCAVIKYIKTEFANNNTLHISGWIKPSGGAEQALNGLIYCLSKKQVLRTINKIKELL